MIAAIHHPKFAFLSRLMGFDLNLKDSLPVVRDSNRDLRRRRGLKSEWSEPFGILHKTVYIDNGGSIKSKGDLGKGIDRRMYLLFSVYDEPLLVEYYTQSSQSAQEFTLKLYLFSILLFEE